MEGDFQVGRWLVQPKLNAISGKGKTAHLEPKAMQVLLYLAEHAGEVMPKERIIQSVWADTFVTDDVLTRAISELRKAFEDDPHEPRFIQTIPKGGYRLIAPVERVGAGLGPAQGQVIDLPLRRLRRWVLAVGAFVGVGALAVALNLAGLRDRFFPRPAPPAVKIRLVVLPFDNLSGDPEQEYFSDGMTEEMTAQLARLHPERLAVIGRASAMTYKGTKKTISQIGKDLHVHFVLEGSVRREGKHARITAQLIEVADQTHVWAQSYERDLGDMLAVQGDVGRAIAREINLQLTPQEHARQARARPVIPEAYEAYLKGRYEWNRRNLRKSLEYFTEAIQSDPQYAEAYAGIATVYSAAPSHGVFSPAEAILQATLAARKAIALDDSLAEGHLALALAEAGSYNLLPGAKNEFERALELNPGLAEAHYCYGFVYYFPLGQWDESIREFRKALELEPLSLSTNANLVEVLYWAGRDQEALEQARKTVDLDSQFSEGHYVLAKVLARMARFREALAEAQKCYYLSPRSGHNLALIGYIYARWGKRAEALKVLEEMKELSKKSYVDGYDWALIYTALGQRDEAFSSLEKGLHDRSWRLNFLKFDRRLESLRADPRFQDLLRRMNFPP